MVDTERYQKLGLMVGLELHQQLNTDRKLYCHCPTTTRDDEPDGTFIRRLRPTQSEMGEVDPAALFEFQKQKRFCYEYYNETTCLVESDEEPPHDLCEDAIDICLTVANFLHSMPVDEIHPMRKIVIDGSNTTGFQRTAIIANGGEISVGGKSIGIQTICLEEDAARKIADDDKNNMRIYRLDRLGIPLIEVATDPDIRSPSEAQEVALAIGLLLRSTGRVKRGLGTIRQDVNVSIRNGAIIEIKGFQQLDMLSTLIELEAFRQAKLLEIRDTLKTRGITQEDINQKSIDITDVFTKTESKVIRNAITNDGVVYAIRLPGFSGLIGMEIQPERRLGTEFSDYAKFWGSVGGIFHSDELPKYGITDNDVLKVRKLLRAKEEDAVVIVASSKQNCQDALDAVILRAKEAVKGVPAETRTPLPNGTSKYARPRPGSSRMYPETDVRPVKITEFRLNKIKKNMPETIEHREKRFIKEYGLSADLAYQITRSINLDIFEHVIKETEVAPTLVAATLENTLVSLSRDQVPTENLQEHHFIDLFKSIEKNKLSSEAIPTILTHLANNPNQSIEAALQATDLAMASSIEIEVAIRRIVKEREGFIREQGERSIGGLMGLVMKEFGGKIDGKIVRDLLLVEIRKLLEM
ncbi:MAG: Glu-tRNA(Gln) amidotransferase subunit GatE [Candidatus Thorarchaeota archaeon]|nr:Glu-tRNA(Gln) amidotransferase subunit GatE [Candidatus Thorarchaeota archaeon]